MHTLFILILPFLIFFKVASHDDTIELYKKAISLHTLAVEKGMSQEQRNKFAHKTIFIIDDCGIEIPAEISSHKLQVLDDSVTSILKGEGGSIVAIKLNPIKINHGDVVIVLNDYVVKDDHGVTKFSYAGGREYIFSYDNKGNKYMLKAAKGISY